jgi:hypothetical protein
MRAPRSISETLLDFARPLLEHLPEDTTAAQRADVLRLAVTVWNAIVKDRRERGTRHLGEVRAQLEAAEEPGRTVMLSVLEALVARKRLLFEADLRVIGPYAVPRELTPDAR